VARALPAAWLGKMAHLTGRQSHPRLCCHILIGCCVGDRYERQLFFERQLLMDTVLILECGVIVPQGPARLREILPSVLAQRTDVLSPRMIRLIEELADDWRRLDDRVDAVTSEVQALARQDECCQRLTSVPGIGALTASAVVATIGNGAAFSKGRDFGAWLGLVPKQLSTGDRTILGRLSKRGNKYVRTLFIIGARAVLAKPGSWAKFGLQKWLAAAVKRLHHNVLAAALANKLARIAWSVLYHGRSFARDLEILRHPALETGPAKLYERLAMRVCCAADRPGELTCGIQQRR
jgi:transposase